jgi:hypothetical protein
MRKISSLPGADRPSVEGDLYIGYPSHLTLTQYQGVCVSIDPSFQKSQKVVFPRAHPPPPLDISPITPLLGCFLESS